MKYLKKLFIPLTFCIASMCFGEEQTLSDIAANNDSKKKTSSLNTQPSPTETSTQAQKNSPSKEEQKVADAKKEAVEIKQEKKSETPIPAASNKNLKIVIPPAPERLLEGEPISPEIQALLSLKKTTKSKAPEENSSSNSTLEDLVKMLEDEAFLKPRSIEPKIHTIQEQDLPSVVQDIGGKEFLEPWQFGDVDKKITIAFQNTDLSTFITYMEHEFDLKFIMDDAIQPLIAGGRSPLGAKISFTTNSPLNKKQAWDLFTMLLDTAGLTVLQTGIEKTYRITTIGEPNSPKTATRGPLPLFINTDISLIPDNDTLVRYLYFVQNASLQIIKNVVDSLRSPISSLPIFLIDKLRAVILTDKGSSVRHIMTIIQELDRVNMPESLFILNLKHADAQKVVELYSNLTGGALDQKSIAERLGAKKTIYAFVLPRRRAHDP